MSVHWDSKGAIVHGPSWGALVNQAALILGFEDIEFARARVSDLQILEYFKRKHAGQTAKLTNWLSKLMDPPDTILRNSIIHTELVNLTKCKLFYTTNFDNFIERSFGLHCRSAQVVALEQQMGVAAESEIIKFHGDLDHPNQIVLTESDYERRLSLSTPLDHRLRADLLGRVVLFLGYSFRDPNISYLFRLFTDEFWEKNGSLPGDRAYITVPDPSDIEYELFQARRIRVIPVSSIDPEQTTLDVADLLSQMRS